MGFQKLQFVLRKSRQNKIIASENTKSLSRYNFIEIHFFLADSEAENSAGNDRNNWITGAACNEKFQPHRRINY